MYTHGSLRTLLLNATTSFILTVENLSLGKFKPLYFSRYFYGLCTLGLASYISASCCAILSGQSSCSTEAWQKIPNLSIQLSYPVSFEILRAIFLISERSKGYSKSKLCVRKNANSLSIDFVQNSQNKPTTGLYNLVSCSAILPGQSSHSTGAWQKISNLPMQSSCPVRSEMLRKLSRYPKGAKGIAHINWAYAKSANSLLIDLV